MTDDQREIHRKKRILEYAERVENINKTFRYFAVARSTFYLWRDGYRELGEEGLRSRRCGPHNHPNKTPDEVVEKILHLRRTYHMGPIRIVWHLRRYHGISTSDATVHRVCKRHGLNRLPDRVGRRTVHTHRHEKQAPGHHVQVDLKFLTLKRKKGASVRRYQYTAIHDATCVRALKIYRRHTQAKRTRPPLLSASTTRKPPRAAQWLVEPEFGHQSGHRCRPSGQKPSSGTT